MQKNNASEEKITLELTKDEYESFKKLKEKDEERKRKPNNIYQNLKINPKILDWVIVGGILAIIIIIIIGM